MIESGVFVLKQQVIGPSLDLNLRPQKRAGDTVITVNDLYTIAVHIEFPDEQFAIYNYVHNLVYA